ncbi:uncharacterized protein MONOS_9827 [Monocercomonoides exilis]|uniref:uncharacterized protein n=1 Tax=Monocercomonoides exilis TaxID=2049356 RepID=UPI003559A879|nr:hypothetical protein MONOS_9827 [Monocercomonoides exilis]|eukprot:MONOS_9827.1-p1 / transcript=MONOS_9827.1 / gene=MONOS_9827 / organism=Monocercomonoides_exilis_PA203 / gene_product=unspecified product / transcript_product=unspecified product / location=Mono_scaffold00420:33816-34679(-) / protein_length=288 / sequence_SO=supercontig / SO=protein_coding / is_pseudo=false
MNSSRTNFPNSHTSAKSFRNSSTPYTIAHRAASLFFCAACFSPSHMYTKSPNPCLPAPAPAPAPPHPALPPPTSAAILSPYIPRIVDSVHTSDGCSPVFSGVSSRSIGTDDRRVGGIRSTCAVSYATCPSDPDTALISRSIAVCPADKGTPPAPGCPAPVPLREVTGHSDSSRSRLSVVCSRSMYSRCTTVAFPAPSPVAAPAGIQSSRSLFASSCGDSGIPYTALASLSSAFPPSSASSYSPPPLLLLLLLLLPAPSLPLPPFSSAPPSLPPPISPRSTCSSSSRT